MDPRGVSDARQQDAQRVEPAYVDAMGPGAFGQRCQSAGGEF
jgi:hypothetical protein